MAFFLGLVEATEEIMLFPFCRMSVAKILQRDDIQKKKAVFSDCLRERKTGLGPATSTLARLRSTN